MKIKMMKAFLMLSFFCAALQGMEVAPTRAANDGTSPQKKKKGIVITIPGSASETSSHSSARTNRADGQKKHTPRTFDELESIVKAKSKKTPFLKVSRPGDIPTTSVSVPPSSDDTSAELSPEEVLQNVERFAEELRAKIYIDHKVMAEAALRVHKEKDKDPLHEEKKGYKQACAKDEEYDHLAQELLKRMILMQLMGEENLPPSEKIIDTHVGILRDTIANKNSSLYWTRIAAFAGYLISAGLTAWGSYGQSHAGDSSCNSTSV